MEITGVSAPSSGPRASAAAPAWGTFVARITTSTRWPTSAGVPTAPARATVRSPDAPATRRPTSRTAAMCSSQGSTAHTS